MIQRGQRFLSKRKAQSSGTQHPGKRWVTVVVTCVSNSWKRARDKIHPKASFVERQETGPLTNPVSIGKKAIKEDTWYYHVRPHTLEHNYLPILLSHTHAKKKNGLGRASGYCFHNVSIRSFCMTDSLQPFEIIQKREKMSFGASTISPVMSGLESGRPWLLPLPWLHWAPCIACCTFISGWMHCLQPPFCYCPPGSSERSLGSTRHMV